MSYEFETMNWENIKVFTPGILLTRYVGGKLNYFKLFGDFVQKLFEKKRPNAVVHLINW